MRGLTTANKLRILSSLKPGQPCWHTGCLSHVSHPCEECGLIRGQGPVPGRRIELILDESKLDDADPRDQEVTVHNYV